jgi:hypothetical protein
MRQKMVRVFLAAGAIAMLSNVAFAETGSTTKIIRTTPYGSKTIVKKHADNYGNVVVKKRTSDGFSGSSMNHSRTTIEPGAGGSVTKTHTTTKSY